MKRCFISATPHTDLTVIRRVLMDHGIEPVLPFEIDHPRAIRGSRLVTRVAELGYLALLEQKVALERLGADGMDRAALEEDRRRLIGCGNNIVRMRRERCGEEKAGE